VFKAQYTGALDVTIRGKLESSQGQRTAPVAVVADGMSLGLGGDGPAPIGTLSIDGNRVIYRQQTPHPAITFQNFRLSLLAKSSAVSRRNRSPNLLVAIL